MNGGGVSGSTPSLNFVNQWVMTPFKSVSNEPIYDSPHTKKMNIPPLILQKLKRCEQDAHAILTEAKALITDFDTASVRLRVSSSSPSPLMSWAEQAQSLVFVIRYEHLPELQSFVAGRHPNTGFFYLNEIDQIRAALNEYRTIFYNQRDGIFYATITNFYQKSFAPNALNASIRIEALTLSGEDLSIDHLKHLKSRRKAIQMAIRKSDFDYIFNGVLQHTDDKFAMQMVIDYADGSLNYLLLKNVLIAQGLKEILVEHYKVINVMSFPKMGAL